VNLSKIIAKVCLGAIACLSLSSESLAADATKVPTIFKFESGGMAGGITVEWKSGALFYTSSLFGKNQTERLMPTEAQWNEFRSELAKINFSKWRSTYDNTNVLDGFYWSLEIKFDDMRCKTFARNFYPKADGFPSEVETPEFKKFDGALKKLLGKTELN
jgi:hypothetical protein